MLNYNNSDDISEMMNYHRTRDMINLLHYFPDLSPVEDLTIVKDIDDYITNKDYCDSLQSMRNDTIISKPSMKSVETKSLNNEVEKIFAKVKDLDSNGVLVMFNVFPTPKERYQRYAGIAVSVSLGNNIIIEAVGKGFDGREVSKGISTHERYIIPWYDIPGLNISNFKNYRTYLINDNDYQTSRNERVTFLKNIGIDENVIDENVPIQYNEIPVFIWQDVITKLIKKVYNMEEELDAAGFNEFAVSGHTEGCKYTPWQMFDMNRGGNSLTLNRKNRN